MLKNIKYTECWAKTTPDELPGISVEQHCRTAGIIAGLLVAQCPAWLRNLVMAKNSVVLAALHDVGKVSPGFQRKCPAWLKKHGLTIKDIAGSIGDHAQVSQKTLQDVLAKNNMRFWAAIVGAHHGELKGDWIGGLSDGGEHWASERRRLVDVLLKEFGPLPDVPVHFNCGALWFNAGLVTVADWLASDEISFPPSMELDATTIRERAAAQLDRVGFQPVACLPDKKFSDIFLFSPHALQTIFSEIVRRPGVYIVEAAMGCGKTEAALMAAYNLIATGQATGIYFALPTQVTSNRIHERMAAFVDRISPGAGVRLIHGAAWLMDAVEILSGAQFNDAPHNTKSHTGRDWFASPRRALLAPFGVGTVDQALLGVVAAKHFFVRQFGLAGKVVILDEIHSYDLYTGTLVDQLVSRLRELGATVIILSATLTAARRQKLLGVDATIQAEPVTDYPLLSGMCEDELVQRAVPPDALKHIRVQFIPLAELAGACLARAQRGECVLWIRNTVNDAQETYRQLRGRNQTGGPEIALLHARFPQFRREQLEKDWLGRLGKEQSSRPAGGCVLVATQVAEQSVDIDADLLITDLAPTDMLLQRIGRLWRHSRPRPAACDAPETWVAAPELDATALRNSDASGIKLAFGRSSKVYAPYVLLRTFELWRTRHVLVLPADIRPLLEATYAVPPADEPDPWRVLHAELEKRHAELQGAAVQNGNPWQMQFKDEEGRQTRWNSRPSIAVLLVCKIFEWNDSRGARIKLLNGEECKIKAWQFSLAAARSIHRNLVNVPRWCVDNGGNDLPVWLREYVHGGDMVVCKLDGEKLLRIPDGSESGMSYRDDLGVVISKRPGGIGAARSNMGEEDDESYDW